MKTRFILRVVRKVGLFLVAAIASVAMQPVHAASAAFDFDTGTPTLSLGQNVPLDQTSGGVTANFSAATGGFSVQSSASTFFTLSQFSGNYLYPNSADSVLVIQFSQSLTNLALGFATAEQTPIENPTPIQLIAYTDSTNTPPLGSTTAGGTYFGGNTLPMGSLIFNSATPFNLVTINIQPGGATGFLLDNISGSLAVATLYTITTSASPPAGGTTTGDGAYPSGAPVTVVATPQPDYAFVNWTEEGIEVSPFPVYDFTATASRTLVANFAPAYTVATSASPSDGGSTAGGGTYSNGSQVTVVATANPGYAFVNWREGGVVVSSSASYSFTANADRTLAANFTPRLAITASSPDAILLSWPAPSAGFILQQNSACAPTGWVDVSAPVNVVGGQNRVTISPADKTDLALRIKRTLPNNPQTAIGQKPFFSSLAPSWLLFC